MLVTLLPILMSMLVVRPIEDASLYVGITPVTAPYVVMPAQRPMLLILYEVCMSIVTSAGEAVLHVAVKVVQGLLSTPRLKYWKGQVRPETCVALFGTPRHSLHGQSVLLPWQRMSGLTRVPSRVPGLQTQVLLNGI